MEAEESGSRGSGGSGDSLELDDELQFHGSAQTEVHQLGGSFRLASLRCRARLLRSLGHELEASARRVQLPTGFTIFIRLQSIHYLAQLDEAH